MNVEVTLCGDRELWVIYGTYKKGDGEWRVPFFVDPYSEKPDMPPTFYKLEPAVFLNAEMLEAVELKIRLYNRGSGDIRILKVEDLQKVAVKAPGITPEYYLNWRTFENEDKDNLEVQQVVEEVDFPSEAKAFCEYIVNSTQIVPIGTMKLIYRAIVAHGMEWVLEKKKPLHLGFVRLVPVPYRVNWKQILLALAPSSPWAFRQSLIKRDALLLAGGWTTNVYNTKLAAVGRTNPLIQWKVELIHDDSWWKAVEKHETKIYAALGPSRYITYFRNAIKSAFPHILEAYSSWCKRISVPCAGLDNGKLFGNRVLRAWVPEGRVTPAAPLQGDVSCVVSDDFAQLTGPKLQSEISPEDETLQFVRRLLPKKANVRLCGEPSGDNAGSSDGVPMLHEGKKPDEAG